jgi:RHS repeat-associated protein
MNPARADTYARPTLYQITGESNCTDVIVEPLPSSAATAENCLNDYYPKTILLPCSWWWYETGTQTWPSGASNATLWIKSYNPYDPNSTCANASGGFLAYANSPQACPYGGTLSGSQCINTAPCGLGQTRNADGSCTAKEIHHCPCVGDPIQPALGNTHQAETDYSGGSASTLDFTRNYNSIAIAQSTLGPQWRHTYDRSLQVVATGPPHVIYARRQDGRVIPFTQGTGTSWTADSDVNDVLTTLQNSSGIQTGWQYWVAADESTELYDDGGRLLSITYRGGVTLKMTYGSTYYVYPTGAPTCNPPQTNNVPTGLLACVTDSFGHQLNLAYNASNNLSTMWDPAQGAFTYAYTSGTLTSVTYPGNTVRTYVYNESANTGGANLPYAVTGIVDENNARYGTFQYNTSGVGVLTQHAGGADQYSLSYSSNQTTVTDPLGTARTYTFSTVLGVARATALSQSCTYCNVAQSTTYDANGNVSSKTDFNGNATHYTFDLTRNLETSRTEAYGTSVARTISTQWDSVWRHPDLITEPNRTTGFSYDGSGNTLTKAITDTTVTPNVTQTWTYTYDSYGRMLTAKGARTDVNSTTTYAYYTCTTGSQCGQLQTVTDPVGNVTTHNTYNAHGQPLTITDPNGVVTTLTYDNRLRLTSRQVGSETTSFSYYPTGLLKQVTLPDSSYVLYTYDNAHRLTQISDGAGNSIQYTLDNMGNRTAEKTYDPSSVLHRTHTRAYNTLNELYQDINAAGTSAVTTTYGYDSNGNQTTINAPLTRNTTNVYDPLNRLSQITDPNNGNTYFGYDAQDNLTSVKDPRSFTTSYTYSGFRDLKQQVSPDTGTTVNTYDSGGNLSTSTDARNAVSSYAYDVANRATSITYKVNGVADQTITFGYDTGTNGKGRLTSASDANHSLSWSYDTNGRVTGKGLTIGSVNKSVGYGYTNADLTSIVTPSNQSVTYGYNTNHQVTSIAVNGTTVLSGVTYEPFGGVNGWTWGNGTTVSRSFNGDGLVSQIVTAGVTLGYSFDNANRITGISDSSNSALTWTYGYDSLDRVTSGTTTSITDGWTYDANGNRLTQTGTTPITFSVASASNQLTATTGHLVRSYSYDAAGHTSAYGSYTFTFNNRGRMKSTSASTTNYLYNALGQMIEKSGTAGTTIFMQDETGHLLGEYNGTGGLIEETIWLGDIPVATLRPNGSSVNIFYVHTDHLNSPRKVSRPSDNKLEWRWDADPFGTTAANQNPAGLGTFAYGLRFPGQYYMAETGLNQNYFRDYDPLTGKYIESDPIGLKAGVNTYTYGLDNPVMNIDNTGLNTKVTVRCGLLSASQGGSLGGVHCEVVAYCDKTGERLAFGIGGGGNGTFGRLFGGSIPPKYKPGEQPRGPGLNPGQTEYTASCGQEGSCGCPNMSCLKGAFASTTPLPYFALSQNSNTFAHSLLSQCGCSLGLTPSGAVAWGNIDPGIPVGP